MRFRLFLVLALVVIGGPLGVAADQSGVGPVRDVSSGLTERTWDQHQKPPVGFVMFVSTPQLDPSTTLYYLRGKCDIDNRDAHNDKVVFQTILLLGIDTEAWIEPAKTRP